LKALPNGVFGQRPAKAIESKEDVVGLSKALGTASQLQYE
jgi:hypothetical protein